MNGRVLPRLADGAVPDRLYRVMSEGEWRRGLERGAFGHLRAVQGETLHASAEPVFHHAEPGRGNVLVAIGYLDEDGWRAKWAGDGCVAVADWIPADRVEVVARGTRADLEHGFAALAGPPEGGAPPGPR